jgi:hypothetical protein
METCINVKDDYRAIWPFVRQVISRVIRITDAYANLPRATRIDGDGSIIICSNAVQNQKGTDLFNQINPPPLSTK